MSEFRVEPYYEMLVRRRYNSTDLFTKREMEDFAGEKKLYDYQVEALDHALRLLYKWGQTAIEQNEQIAKKEIYDALNNISDGEMFNHNLRLKKKNMGQIFEYLRERYDINRRTRYGYDYQEVDFENFANQMGFWMATGSGKTLVIIKLIELVHRLSKDGSIPEKDILLLVPDQDIMNQFEDEVREYNKFGDYSISFHDAENYGKSVQTQLSRSYGNTINVYTKRSDLINDKTSENEISFEDIENGGNWYLFLDEAHKGESSTSKRQAYFSMLSRNGFMFNASATFTDPSNIATTVYNYNIERFNSDGYGKNIMLADESLRSITDDEFNEETKRKVVLQSLITLTAQKKAKKEIEHRYHEPLLTAFVNSVNPKDSDLEMFFRVLESVAKNHQTEVFREAKREVSDMFQNKSEYEFGNDKLSWSDISDISKKDVLEEVFNSSNHASLEVKHSKQNDKEIAFKLKSSTSPFALMRIGRKSNWLSNKLDDKSVEEKYDFRSYFNNINSSESPINILLGSRSFYEGWDSNRPNVMLFINLGRSSKKKLVMQAIGRGMRIEPIPDERKRLKYTNLRTEHDDFVSTIETLAVFATSVDNFDSIIESFEVVKDTNYSDIEGIERTASSFEKDLYIPTYERGEIPTVDEISRFEGDKELLKEAFNRLPKSTIPIHTSTNDFETIERIATFLDTDKFENQKFDRSVYTQLKRLQSHVTTKKRETSDFRDASEDGVITHFRDIKANIKNENEISDIEDKISKIKKNDNISLFKDTSVSKEGEFLEKYGAKLEDLNNHYYSPIIYGDTNNFKNIINVESEVEFLDSVTKGIESGLFENVDWWHFSAVSEHLDNVYIPYSEDERFRPDFVFWVKKDQQYHIIFVDPKSVYYANHRKIDGYEDVFTEDGNPIEYRHNGENIKVHLRFYNKDLDYSEIDNKYEEYWIKCIKDIDHILDD